MDLTPYLQNLRDDLLTAASIGDEESRRAAALLVGGVLALIATITLTNGINQFKTIHPTPERTVETIKENVEWAKQQAK